MTSSSAATAGSVSRGSASRGLAIRGSMPALVTPLRDGVVDEAALRAFVEWQVAEGSHGLVPVGTTGESPTLSHDEHKRVIEVVIEVAAGRLPVIAGAGSNNTAEAIDLAQHAQGAGADALLVVTPYYNRPTQAGLAAHFTAIHDATDLPVLIYNIPARSVVDMGVETMARLAELPRIVGVKDATADLARVSAQRLACGVDFVQLSGEDATALGHMAHGGVGCISVTANVAPALCARFQAACLEGDFDAARAIQDRLMPLHTALFIEANPGPVKYALSLLGQMTEDVRLPLVPLTEGTRTRVREAMAIAGLLDA